MFRFVCALVLPLLLAISSLSAFSMGRDGDSYKVGGIQWQKVKYTDEQNSLSAALPGAPKSALVNNKRVFYSTVGASEYELQILPSSVFNLPQDQDECIEIFDSPTSQVSILTPAQATVQYMFQVDFYDKSLSKREVSALVLASENALYVARIDGSDYSLQDIFFDSILINQR